jgi:hypothetical protein
MSLKKATTMTRTFFPFPLLSFTHLYNNACHRRVKSLPAHREARELTQEETAIIQNQELQLEAQP